MLMTPPPASRAPPHRRRWGGRANYRTKKGRSQAALPVSSEPYCFGQGWTFISGPRSYGGGTCASVLTWLDSAQSKARLKRAQNSLSSDARWAVRLANSVTSTSTLKRLLRLSACRLRALVLSSAWYLPRNEAYRDS